MAGWNVELDQWLKPFVARLGHKARARMCPLYVSGLIGPGARKSMEPMAARVAPGRYDRLHHFISEGIWDGAPLEAELAHQGRIPATETYAARDTLRRALKTAPG